MAAPRMERREFVVVCPFCNEVLGLRFGDQRVFEGIHECGPHDEIDQQLNTQQGEGEP